MKIRINIDKFEHLLNCLANQKWLHQLPQDDQKEAQKIIDESWRWGMDIVNCWKNFRVIIKGLIDNAS